MTDIYERKKRIGERIKEMRTRCTLTQGELAVNLSDLLHREIGQSTISGWENGVRLPSLENIVALSYIFQCDCGYLLCDYDQTTFGQDEICKATGLSPKSIQFLCTLRAWGIGAVEASTVDFLLTDARERNQSHHYRSIIDLLNFFLSFENKCTSKQVFSNGAITDFDADGTICQSAVRLDGAIIENAVLMEIQQALLDIKHGRA